MEMIRIVREMRHANKADKSVRFLLWENVPGAFSSNKGEDFKAVLEEIAKTADGDAVIPRPPKNKWTDAGAIVGDGWSIAWRVFDAQLWSVPQRRRRIYLVADFGGQCAAEILFKREGLRRHLAQSREAREGTATDVERSFNVASWDCRGKGSGAVAGTLKAQQQMAVCAGFNGFKSVSGSIQYQEDKAATLEAGMPGNVAVLPFNATQITSPKNGNNPQYGDPCHPLCATDYAPHIVQKVNCQPSGIAGTVSSKWAKGTGGPAGDECYNLVIDEVARPLSAQPQMRHRLDMDNVVFGVDCRNATENNGLSATLQKNGSSLNVINPVRVGYMVRRLTPLECERLQDYPDGWTDIVWEETTKKGKVRKKTATDCARYKALGNSIAVCCAEYVLEGIKEVLEVAI